MILDANPSVDPCVDQDLIRTSGQKHRTTAACWRAPAERASAPAGCECVLKLLGWWGRGPKLGQTARLGEREAVENAPTLLPCPLVTLGALGGFLESKKPPSVTSGGRGVPEGKMRAG
jgi:hypothetical protein